PAAKRFSCYPTGATSRQPLYLAETGTSLGFVNLDMSNVFPNGYFSMRLTKITATGFRLDTAWRIYFDTGRYWAPVNQCILTKFAVKWRGNIVLTKH
ncbi:hypothetical protein C8R43DRAFT_842109, partial [Mycena crocata]